MTDEREYPVPIKEIYFQVKVTDIERAKKFYEDTFNFEISWYMGPEAGWCELFLPGKVAKLGLNLVEKDHEYLPNSGVLTFNVPDLKANELSGMPLPQRTKNPRGPSRFRRGDALV